MAFAWKHFARFLHDPPPEFAVELSEAGIAWTRRAKTPQKGFVLFTEPVLAVSPLKDNVVAPDLLLSAVQSIAPANGHRKRRHAAVILPDYCSRMAVLDFDSFPAEPAEQLSLVRFRFKKSVPFDVESAAISFHQQPAHGGGKKIEVVAAMVSLEILARYEAPFRAAGLQPGFVTISTLSALDLLHGDNSGIILVAKLGGRVLTLSVLENGRLRMVRCLELERVNMDEVLAVLYPTLAYIEDELGARPAKLELCGFDGLHVQVEAHATGELGLGVEPLRSRFGSPGPHDAGLLGYLESAEE